MTQAFKRRQKAIEKSRRRAYNKNKKRYKALCRKENETVTQFQNRASKHIYKDLY